MRQRHKAPADVEIFNQHLPDDFAELLGRLYVEGQRHRIHNDYFNCVLAVAHDAGWTLVALAEPLGVTRERIRQRIRDASTVIDPGLPPLPSIPDPPRRVPPLPKPEVSAGMAAWLRDMYRIAVTVNGATPLSDPRRGVSLALSAVIADLIDRCGVPGADVARALGVKPATVWFRLRRHGYRHSAPSQPSYRGECVWQHKVTADSRSPGERYEAWLREKRVRL
jgi:hypothetical protein